MAFDSLVQDADFDGINPASSITSGLDRVSSIDYTSLVTERECGNNFQTMRLKNYRDDLLGRLRNPEYAAAYLAQVLAERDQDAFLVALKDVVEAAGGIGALSGQVGLKRPSLYKILSKHGNPTLSTLQEILKPLRLRVSISMDEAA